MQFLKTIFWVLVAVVVALFASRNWAPVTLKLWGEIQADIKIPALLLFMFLLGLVPTWLVMQGKLWAMKRRVEALERNRGPIVADPEPAGDELAGEAIAVSPVFVAIDTPDLERALALCGAVREDIGGVKLGLEFFASNGPDGVRAVAALGLPIFLDLKLHDIPNTVAKAVAALAPLKPAVMTVHAAGGKAMLEAAKGAAPAATKIVGVTVLTSLDGDDLGSIGVAGTPADQVARLARLCESAGLDGIVCSGAEVAIASDHWPSGYFVVPGVRPEGGDSADQKRIVTPSAALADGASMLVIGRPITAAPDPASAARAIANSLKRHVL